MEIFSSAIWFDMTYLLQTDYLNFINIYLPTATLLYGESLWISLNLLSLNNFQIYNKNIVNMITCCGWYIRTCLLLPVLCWNKDNSFITPFKSYTDDSLYPFYPAATPMPASGNHQSVLYILNFLDAHVSEIMQYLSFSVW